MKKLKKFASLILAMVLALAMAIPAMAAEDGEGSIEINNAVVKQTYTIYQIFTLDSNYVPAEGTAADTAGTGQYSYRIADAWKPFFATPTNTEAHVVGADYVEFFDDGYVKGWKENKSAEEFAKEALAWAKANSIASQGTQTVTAPEGDPEALTNKITFSDLELGYYLVDSTTGALCSLNTTNPTAEIEEKNETPTPDKTVKKDGEGDDAYTEKNTAAVGDVLDYKVEITVQPTVGNYVVHDTMTKGLTFNEDIKVFVGDQEITTGFSRVPAADQKHAGCTFELTFDEDYLKTLDPETVITITYTATINQDAEIKVGNDVTLDFGNGDNVTTTPPENVETYVFDLNILKYTEGADGTETPLADAKFTLSKDADGNNPLAFSPKTNDAEDEEDAGAVSYVYAKNGGEGTTTTITTTASGAFKLCGLEAGTYYLTETEAPAGYNKLQAPIKVTITEGEDGEYTIQADEETVADQIKVENNHGTLLPSTGGMGTTIFYVLGGVLVVAAGIMLVVRKRMSAE